MIFVRNKLIIGKCNDLQTLSWDWRPKSKMSSCGIRVRNPALHNTMHQAALLLQFFPASSALVQWPSGKTIAWAPSGRSQKAASHCLDYSTAQRALVSARCFWTYFLSKTFCAEFYQCSERLFHCFHLLPWFWILKNFIKKPSSVHCYSNYPAC